ncbi:MAG: TonB-dependent receptor [Bacteroidetes bacterium]|nr:TonB-dependent receptor [Bacteroidota bacterium]
MKTFVLLTMVLVLTSSMSAQEILRGVVVTKEPDTPETPVVGASVYWLGTSRGTSTDTAGAFSLAIVPESNTLIVRHAAYRPDTIKVTGSRRITVYLTQLAREIEGVQVVGQQSATVIDYLSAESVQRMTQKELGKAACCNLSESFETNPSVDVSFTDAITGTRQIEMLGLSGIYTQTTLENLPYIRGLTANVGLTFIPGSWMKAINVSKGIGSVANGYESITGQIDVDLRKPNDEDEKRFYVNLYGNADQRFEGNFNFRQSLDERWASMTLLHASSQQRPVDRDADRFLDMPIFTTLNAVQRWSYSGEDGWEGQLVAQFVKEDRRGGTNDLTETLSPSSFRFGTKSEYLRLSGKLGHLFEDRPYQSYGVQWSLGRYRNSGTYGLRSYEGLQETAYLNFLYQSIFGSTLHSFRTGASILVDRFDERFQRTPYERTERVPGAFFEYTYAPVDEWSLVAGIRADYHNAFGTMLAPRLHIRYSPTEDWVLRGVAGRGYRTANIFAENAAVFASSRSMTIDAVNSFGYGLDQEVAWNVGVNVTHYFLVDYREATINLSVYRTFFENQTIADLDSYPREVRFASVANGSYANSAQIELNMQPVERLETRIAYRFLDVRQRLGGTWMQRPLNAQHRALVNIAFATEREEEEGPVMTYDLTVQWFGPKRIPATQSNPEGLRAPSASPSFATLNVQVTRSLFAGLELYVGGENLFDFRQEHPILDAGHPTSPYFDASLVWGPLGGRMIYAGLRWGM